MKYEANSPEEYLEQVPDERKEALNKIRKTDGYNIYRRLDQTKHRRFKVPTNMANILLPWVHIVISNLKRAFHGI
jgi:hypothetical protein